MIQKKKIHNQNKPITLKNRSLDEHLYVEKPILLYENGDIVCGDKLIKNRPGLRYIRDQYKFILEYLTKERLKLNISNFCKKNIWDVIDELDRENQKSISRNKLFEIFRYNNEICEIRNSLIYKIRDTNYKRWRREYNKLLGTDSKKANKMQVMVNINRKKIDKIKNL